MGISRKRENKRKKKATEKELRIKSRPGDIPLLKGAKRGQSPALSICLFSASPGWFSPCWAAGLVPPRDSGSAGWMRSGGQGKGRVAALDVLDSGESAGSGWEHQRKAGVKAPSSFDPGEFAFELKKP